MKLSFKRTKLALAVAALAGSSAALAADTDTLTVTAEVPASCVISGPATLSFGQVDLENDTDAQGDVSVFCNTNTGTIALNGGGTGDINGRQMGGDTTAGVLGYQLYTDTARTDVFGDGTTGTSPGLATGPNTVTVYGRVTAAQASDVNALPDTYTDTVTVTVNP